MAGERVVGVLPRELLRSCPCSEATHHQTTHRVQPDALAIDFVFLAAGRPAGGDLATGATREPACRPEEGTFVARGNAAFTA